MVGSAGCAIIKAQMNCDLPEMSFVIQSSPLWWRFHANLKGVNIVEMYFFLLSTQITARGLGKRGCRLDCKIFDPVFFSNDEHFSFSVYNLT